MEGLAQNVWAVSETPEISMISRKMAMRYRPVRVSITIIEALMKTL